MVDTVDDKTREDLRMLISTPFGAIPDHAARLRRAKASHPAEYDEEYERHYKTPRPS